MFRLASRLLSQRINVVVVGVGGSGSHLATDLAVLHGVLLDLGHPAGLQVTLVDADTVSDANVGRARFYAADVGLSKAEVLAHRINMCHGSDFEAVHGDIGECAQVLEGADVVFGCVDTRKSRRQINRMLTDADSGRWREAIWVDLGNGADDGQVVLGVRGRPSQDVRPPTVVDLYPDMLDESRDPRGDEPSCSRSESIARQGIFVNKTAALHAVTMLSTLLRHGAIDHTAVFFNVRKGVSGTLKCDPAEWARFGYVQPVFVGASSQQHRQG
ncbi:MAG: PRTRC system ThiF family protein [Nevskiaceae bacterium]|nr:MAG: PRTRC system ThiF family protein [Nevskiaceae bacterium]